MAVNLGKYGNNVDKAISEHLANWHAEQAVIDEQERAAKGPDGKYYDGASI